MSDWKSATSKNKSGRVYIGNFNKHADIEERLRDLFSRSAISVQEVEIVPLKQPNAKCYALVKCDVTMAIKCLNGIRFDGNALIVKKEKTQIRGKKKGMSFGGGWATPSASRAKAPQRKNLTVENRTADGAKNSVGLSSKQSTEKVKLNSSENSNENALKEASSDDVAGFHQRCTTSLNKLMEDYGTYDPDYEKMKALNIQSNIDNAPDPPTKPVRDASPDLDSSMLAPNGKAPIHIELVSFGFKYSVPSQARDGWSHSNPLSPIDCRYLPRCPHYVSKLSGLSYKVKRALLSSTINERTSGDTGDNSDEDTNDVKNPFLTKSEELSKAIVNSIKEAINDGGHGYAFPLEAAIYLGSEYGRHRSVVLSENLAQKIRGLLRKNIGGKITQPISVSTRHRDVDQKHKDEEAFGTDLRRKHDAEMKQKRRQERLESNW